MQFFNDEISTQENSLSPSNVTQNQQYNLVDRTIQLADCLTKQEKTCVCIAIRKGMLILNALLS